MINLVANLEKQQIIEILPWPLWTFLILIKDIQTLKHPKLRKYSYESKTLIMKSKIYSFAFARTIRKEKWFVSSIAPNHKAIYILLSWSNPTPRGAGLCKFNSSALWNDEEYVNRIRVTYAQTYVYYSGSVKYEDGLPSLTFYKNIITFLIIYMKKLLDSDWLRAVQFFLNTVQKRGNLMQKKVIKQAFWFVNEQRSSQIANQIYFFQIKRAPWMAQLWRNFFLIAWSLKSPGAGCSKAD